MGPAEEIGEAERSICTKLTEAGETRDLNGDAPEEIELAESQEKEAWAEAMVGGVIPEVHLLAVEEEDATRNWVETMLAWCERNVQLPEQSPSPTPAPSPSPTQSRSATPTPAPSPTPTEEDDEGEEEEESEPAGYDLSIRDNRTNETLSCAGLAVEIQADEATVALHGTCETVRISGERNTVSINSVEGRLTVAGRENNVSCSGNAGSVHDSGTGNTLRGPCSD